MGNCLKIKRNISKPDRPQNSATQKRAPQDSATLVYYRNTSALIKLR